MVMYLPALVVGSVRLLWPSSNQKSYPSSGEGLEQFLQPHARIAPVSQQEPHHWLCHLQRWLDVPTEDVVTDPHQLLLRQWSPCAKTELV